MLLIAKHICENKLANINRIDSKRKVKVVLKDLIKNFMREIVLGVKK